MEAHRFDLANCFGSASGSGSGSKSGITLLKVEKVHAQLIFTTLNEADKPPPANGNEYVLVDFSEAVKGMGLYCADLTNYVFVNDNILAEELVVDQNGVKFAKSVMFNFDITARGFNETFDYYVGTGTIEHVGDWFAVISNDDHSVVPSMRELLMPATALTIDSLPIGHDADEHLTRLIMPGDRVIYKVAQYLVDEASLSPSNYIYRF